MELDQAYYAVLLGVLLGVLYDLFRFFRIVFRVKFFADFFFWIISAFIVYCYFLVFNRGILRAIFFVLIFIGALLYLYTLGYVTKRAETKLFRLNIKLKTKIKNYLKNITKKLKKLLHSLYNIYYNNKDRFRHFVTKIDKGECDEREKS